MLMSSIKGEGVDSQPDMSLIKAAITDLGLNISVDAVRKRITYKPKPKKCRGDESKYSKYGRGFIISIFYVIN